MAKKNIWYDYTEIDKKNAQYNLIIGERSNGKTYGAIKKAFTNYIKRGEHSVMLRRFDDDLMPKNLGDLWTSMCVSGEIKKISKGKYNSILYYRRNWYAAYYDDESNEYTLKDDKPFMHALALNTMEHTKSGFSDPDVTMIIFDEFLTRQYYLKNEFVLLCNIISTIVRQRDNVKIYMLANTVNFSAPYFREMGIKNIKEMERGKIDVYKYNDANGNDTGLRVAVEYCLPTYQKGFKKKSDVYFAFDNAQIQMITSGTWEIPTYPHPDWRVSNSQLITNQCFLEFENEMLQLELFGDSIHGAYVVVHPMSSDFKLSKTCVVYSLDNHFEYQYRYGREIKIKLDRLIWSLYDSNKWLYSDNTTGEIVNNFVKGIA